MEKLKVWIVDRVGFQIYFFSLIRPEGGSLLHFKKDYDHYRITDLTFEKMTKKQNFTIFPYLRR